MPKKTDPLTKLRAICMAYPQTLEKLSHGEPTWFAGGKRVFVMFSNHHHGGPLAFWCPAPEGAQDVLVNAAPDRFFVPPYVGPSGWLGVRLDSPHVDWDEAASLIDDAWRKVAPKRLAAAFGADSPTSTE